MRITESKLRRVIRSVIRESAKEESAKEELEFYDSLGHGYLPNLKKIGNAYFQHLHNDHGKLSPEQWAEANLNMNSYSDDKKREEVFDMLKKAAKDAEQIHYGY